MAQLAQHRARHHRFQRRDPVGDHAGGPARDRQHAATMLFELTLYVLGVTTALLSVEPVRNLLSRQQAMNRSYNRFHLVNTYGAFGRVTRTRYEIVLEGTDDSIISQATHWQEYGFKAKPGDPRRRPPQVAPYHLRLDWAMWFLPLST